MKKRILKIIAVFLVLFVSLNGCAKKERGKMKDTVIIGLDNTFVPMGFLDEK